MMIKTNAISDVSHFAVNRDSLVLIHDQRKIVVRSADGEEIRAKYVSDDNLQGVEAKGGVIWANSSYSPRSLLIKDGVSHPKNYHIKDYAPETGCFYVFADNLGVKLSPDDDVVWTTDDRFFYFFKHGNHFFYAKEKSTLIALDDDTGTLLWRYTLPAHYDFMRKTFRSDPEVKERAKILQIIGTYQGVLWLSVQSDQVNLLGLDAKTGEERHQILRPSVIPLGLSAEEAEKLPFFFYLSSQLDEENGAIFGVLNYCYGEVHLNAPQPEYRLYDIRESCEEHRMMMNKFGAWEGDRIYFWDGTSINRFGVFSRAAKEIIWSGQIEEAAAIRNVDYAQGKLYVLDHHHTLHIFQVEG
jgi:hypothetical protein